ncbi:hypothetical protein HN51_041605, partial [Arachis hypogaea]
DGGKKKKKTKAQRKEAGLVLSGSGRADPVEDVLTRSDEGAKNPVPPLLVARRQRRYDTESLGESASDQRDYCAALQTAGEATREGQPTVADAGDGARGSHEKCEQVGEGMSRLEVCALNQPRDCGGVQGATGEEGSHGQQAGVNAEEGARCGHDEHEQGAGAATTDHQFEGTNRKISNPEQVEVEGRGKARDVQKLYEGTIEMTKMDAQEEERVTGDTEGRKFMAGEVVGLGETSGLGKTGEPEDQVVEEFGTDVDMQEDSTIYPPNTSSKQFDPVRVVTCQVNCDMSPLRHFGPHPRWTKRRRIGTRGKTTSFRGGQIRPHLDRECKRRRFHVGDLFAL